MKTAALLILAAAALPAFGLPALAQDNNSELPEICTSGGHGMGAMGSSMGAGGSGMAAMGDQAHQDMMKGMGPMNTQMMAGMKADDIDVAFICGMIPHHQGAIDMAEAELAHGDDPWARELAQRIIDAQKKEIDEMKDWLARQPRN